MKLVPWNCCKALLGVIVLGAVIIGSASCDENVELRRPEIKWDKLVVMSAVPMVKRGEGTDKWFEPICRSTTDSDEGFDPKSDAEGMSLKVLFLGSEKKGSDDDRDMSIQPGDSVKSKLVTSGGVGSSMFELAFTCMDQLPDGSPTVCDSGLQADELSIDSVEFYDYLRNTSDGDVGVAFLVDLGGSMQGLVNPYAPYQYKEDTYSNVNQKLPQGFNFQQNGTDPAGVRLTALQNVIKNNLNAKDRIVVFAFNENTFKVVCDTELLPKITDPDDIDEVMSLCYSVDHELVIGQQQVGGGGGDVVGEGSGSLGTASELTKLQGKERGRTPLWYAVNRVYDFMEGTGQTFRHIVVIGDGPDTCSDSLDLNGCSGECTQYKTEFEEFRDNLLTNEGAKVPWADRVPVHFVQMGSKGYPDRDPRQQEVACLSGGQHLFINAHEIPYDKMQDVLETKLRNLMYTVRGYWQFNLEYGAVSKSDDPPVGWLYAIDGTGKVLPGDRSLLVEQEEVFNFTFGEAGTVLDGRISVRKPCDPDGNQCDTTTVENCQSDVDCPGSVSRFCDTAQNKCVECFEDGHCGEGGTCNTTTKACAYSCRVPVAWCDGENLTCQKGFEFEQNGSTSNCLDEKVKVAVEISVENQPTEYKEVVLGDIQTLCCGGRCVPPDPPSIPTDFRYPPNSGKVCFQYDDIAGWQRETPEDPNSTWVYFAELNSGAGPDCSWTKLQDHLKYDVGTFEFAEHWSCGGSSLNCFAPPGAEVVCDPACADGEKCVGGQCLPE